MTENVPQTLEGLMEALDSRVEGSWDTSTYANFAKSAIALGHPSLAFDILKSGISTFPDDKQLTYLAALSLARGKATKTAGEMLSTLIGRLDERDPLYVEALSLAGRLSKDRYVKSVDPHSRQKAARQSADYYAKAFLCSQDYFPGVNAATMKLVSGDAESARDLATQVRTVCLSKLESRDADNYWLHAATGEACLLLGGHLEAAVWYASAVELAQERFGDIASMRRQVEMLSAYVTVTEELRSALDIPNVAAFSGHMIDRPDARQARFPLDISDAVGAEILKALDRLNARFGYCSLACGADLLFADAMHGRGGEVHAVLPFKQSDFVETSILYAGERWVEKFHCALDRATTVTYASEESYLSDDTLFQYAGDLVCGMAILRAEQLGVAPMLLAVLDNTSERKDGGTADVIARWQRHGYESEIVDLSEIRDARSAPTHASVQMDRSHEKPVVRDQLTLRRQIRTMMFGDVVGFSKLGEAEVPSFFVEFLGLVAGAIKTSERGPDTCNTWGDGLYIVFEHVADGADFALRLRDMVLETDWSTVGLPADTNIRLGMHAGPVYGAIDPVIERLNYFGSHVTRAARIEPITTPGSIFVTEQMAALLAAEGGSEFACDYLGEVPLAKKYGSGNLYRLRRASEIE